jgi:hypothetical protein
MKCAKIGKKDKFNNFKDRQLSYKQSLLGSILKSLAFRMTTTYQLGWFNINGYILIM